MRISGVWYTIKQGLKNIYKNKMFSLASIGTMASCIFLFGIFFAIVANFKSVMNEIESGVAITVFFNQDLSEEETKTLVSALTNLRDFFQGYK